MRRALRHLHRASPSYPALLRVLQSGEVTSVGGRRPEVVDTRIVAATHRDLAAEVADVMIRRTQLFYRDHDQGLAAAETEITRPLNTRSG